MASNLGVGFGTGRPVAAGHRVPSPKAQLPVRAEGTHPEVGSQYRINWPKAADGKATVTYQGHVRNVPTYTISWTVTTDNGHTDFRSKDVTYKP